ncbi:hypothetical protein [Haloferula sargassicola]|uniref:DUF4034 domain-containing protein n=1 Tax=Haloferula sargassicola TaxID=490096 RepID=A0ABP9UJN9_9BACT
MMRTKFMTVGAILAGALACLAWLGSEAGKRVARAGWLHGRADKAETLGSDFAVPARPGKASSPDEEFAVSKTADELEELLGDSHAGGCDWHRELRAQGILESLGPDELAALFQELEGRIAEPWSRLLNVVLLEWARRDPAAAFAATADQYSRAASVFAQWAMEDPTQALAWLDSEDCPPEVEKCRDRMRAQALSEILERDFELATSELLKLPSDDHRGGESWLKTRESVLSRWAYSALVDPALRDRLVDFVKTTGVPEDHARLNEEMLRRWSQDDAMGMLTYLYELRDYLEVADFPAEKRPALEAEAVGAAIYREYDGPALEWWMGRHAESTEVPAALNHALSSWYQKYPDKVRGWFEGQADSPQRDAMLAGLIPSIAIRDAAEAERMLEGIRDPDLHDRAAERLDYMTSEARSPAR